MGRRHINAYISMNLYPAGRAQTRRDGRGVKQQVEHGDSSSEKIGFRARVQPQHMNPNTQ